MDQPKLNPDGSVKQQQANPTPSELPPGNIQDPPLKINYVVGKKGEVRETAV